MRTEVHVHGTLQLAKGTTLAQVETGLRPWLDYLDIDSIEEARSLEQDEPGIVFEVPARELSICWTGEVGRSFHRCVEECMQSLGPLTETTTVIEVTYYHDDGHDEVQLIFVGPSAAEVHEAQRVRMVEDIGYLLGRHFNQQHVDRVVTLVNELFAQDWAEKQELGTARNAEHVPAARRRHLH